MEYISDDTIVAASTPVGGAIAVLRVSGSRALTIAKAMSRQSDFAHAQAVHRPIYDDQKQIDDSVLIFFKSPQSYTGEDLFEIHCHGGPITVELILQTTLQAGARLALPGEFSFRAVKNGKITLSQAEAVADLISAKNREASDLAIEKLNGLMNREVGALAEEARTLVSLSELGIDFSDQDVEEVSLPVLKRRAGKLNERLVHLATTFDRGERIQQGIRTVFMGLPNAGKSSFFNALLGEDRSIVSEIAGTTRDVIRETLKIRGKSSEVTLRIEDTAGLRFAGDALEKTGMARTRQAVSKADLVLLIVNGSNPDWVEVGAWFKELGADFRRTFGVLTHGDQHWSVLDIQAKLIQATGVSDWYTISSTTGQGIHEVTQALAERCEFWTHRTPGELVLTRMEHQSAVCRAVEDIRRALDAVSEDLFAADLRRALNQLSPLIGRTVTEDLLGRIFSQFCIGK